MSMIEHVPALLQAGVTSLKIEGRTKSSYYVAAVTNAYRQAADAALAGRSLDEGWVQEVYKVSHRPYSTGFYFGQPGQYTPEACYFSDSDVVAVVESCDENGLAVLSQRNRFFPGDEVELLRPGQLPVPFSAPPLWDEAGQPLADTRHPRMRFSMQLPVVVQPPAFLRKKRTVALSGHGREQDIQA
jgi:putative protease